MVVGLPTESVMLSKEYIVKRRISSLDFAICRLVGLIQHLLKDRFEAEHLPEACLPLGLNAEIDNPHSDEDVMVAKITFRSWPRGSDITAKFYKEEDEVWRPKTGQIKILFSCSYPIVAPFEFLEGLEDDGVDRGVLLHPQTELFYEPRNFMAKAARELGIAVTHS